MIDTVVLDLGNVLVRWDPRRAFAGRLPARDTDAFLVDFDFLAFNHQQDAGRPWADARVDLAASAPEHLPALDLYVEHIADTLAGPVPGSAELVHDIRASGVRLLGLTNWSAETFHLAETAAPAIGLLEDVLVSGEVGVAKPDPRIFALLTQRFGLRPERTVFADDSAANVAAGSAAGYDAVLFTTADALRADLAARGVALPRT
ncbi:haloacid dehalogenase [Cellulomonas sp. Root930]|nr:haloacid dehalogenase [Cellulomonas sp. Root930]